MRMAVLAGLVAGICALLVGATGPAAAAEETLLWSQRYQSEYAAPEMFPVPPPLDVYSIIYEAFEREGWPISYGAAVRLSKCESSLDPRAEGAAGEVGLFQITAGTWSWASVGAGYGGRSRYDAEANAGTAAWLMAHPELGGVDHWAQFGCGWSL